MVLQSITEWAFYQSSSLLASSGNRWLHVQGVVQRAKQVGSLFDEDDRSLLVAAAWVHDIGYAPTLAQTGFHPLDGANYLQQQGEDRLASLTAYHSEAQFEAHLRGLSSELAKYPREHSKIADALTYCDMTTNSTGRQVTFQERLHDIFARYDEAHIVHQAIQQAMPSLSLAIERTRHYYSDVGLHK